MKRGEIYYINSIYNEEGSEQRAGRPAVIVSNDKNNECSGTVEVVYMTTKPKNDLPTHVFTRSAREPSTILCEQITTVSKDRVGDYYGSLAENELQILDKCAGDLAGAGLRNKRLPGRLQRSCSGNERTDRRRTGEADV